MTTYEAAQKMQGILKRRVRASELNPIAEQLGKHKVKENPRAGVLHYEWTESELVQLIPLMK